MKYNLTILMNGETFRKRTENLKETILSLKPETVLTEVYFIVSKVGSKEKIERRLGLRPAKKLFNDEDALDVFLINLLLE